MKKQHVVFVAVAVLALSLAALGCAKATETPAEPAAVVTPVAQPVDQAPAQAVAIPEPLVQHAAAEITDDNAVAAADQLEKELEQDLAEE